MISLALCKVTIDLALHTLHNQNRSISDHMNKVDNTHDNTVDSKMFEDLIFANIREFVASGIQSSCLY